MTDAERIDNLEARVIAQDIALRFLLLEATPGVKASLVSAAGRVRNWALPLPLTDLQIDQLERLLQSMSEAG